MANGPQIEPCGADVADLAKLAPRDDFLQFGDCGGVQKHMADKQDASFGMGQCDQVRTLIATGRQRLFDKRMDPQLKCSACQP